ncbi:hypothetical protein Nepgr_026039 [Nepenthes gracilis]|uniref:CID domain-containing protein n=1 Tax=Nepenthes gracilis TaxID=150966 RepID=A0AAD3Y234_NEPGR|nr:hypothetical protein Nepgr_026039 [Nepenthes gracilis]
MSVISGGLLYGFKDLVPSIHLESGLCLFSEQILADKLSKLNSTQQCIETLSHWCIFHRGKAEVVVATWNKQFHSSQMVQKVPLLYLANDILQNSKRKGNEFVTEFWKVLPAALKDVIEQGNDHGKNIVCRLVNIWEERRVFGSQAQNLKDVMLGEELPPPLEFSKKRSRSVKIVRRDSRSIRTKLSIGSSAEKIVSAMHLVLSEHSNEDVEMNKCKSVVNHVRKIEKDVDIACSQAKDPKRKTLAEELEEEENTLKHCIEKLKLVEANRLVLVTRLREALHEQESELENVRTQMQVAQALVEEASYMKERLSDENYIAVSKPATETAISTDLNSTAGRTSKRTAADIAAEVADKLAASSSSQLIMTSVLSTFAAEEAKNAGLTTTTSVPNSYTPIPANSVPNLMSKLEQPMPVSDPNVFMTGQPASAPSNHPYQSILVAKTGMQSPSSSSQSQYQLLPNTPSQHYMQTSGVTSAYGCYGSLPPLPQGPPLPPPPEAQSHIMGLMMPLVHQPLQLTQQQMPSVVQQSAPLTQQQMMPLRQQAPAPPGFHPLQPPGMVYYAHPQRHSL